MHKRSARKLDTLGRVVIPSEIRKDLGWSENTILLISQQENHAIVQRDHSIRRCVFCSSTKSLSDFQKQAICAACMRLLKQQQ